MGGAFTMSTIMFDSRFHRSGFISCGIGSTVISCFHRLGNGHPSIHVGEPSMLLGVRVTRAAYALSLSSSNRSLRHHNCHRRTMRTPLGRILTTKVVLVAK